MNCKFLVLLPIFLIGCDQEEVSVCYDYCDMKTEAENQDAVNKLCSVYDEDLSEFEDKCLSSCKEVLTYVVDKEEQSDATKCLQCVIDDIIEPSWQNISLSREHCYKECSTLGGYQFFFTFFVSPPRWECD